MVYLNNAATSWPKPSCVNEAVQACLMGTPASQFRGGSSILKKDVEMLCRGALGELLNITDHERIYFTSGATESLNTVLCGLDYGEAGSSILVTQTEHNSVLRPLMNQPALKDHMVKIVPCTAVGEVKEEFLEKAVEEEKQAGRQPAALIVNHCSNVTGYVQDMDMISRAAKKNDLCLIVDVSQSAGSVPVYADKWKVDALIFTGHKSLLGMQGSGGFYIREGISLKPLKYGGTGRNSSQLTYEEEDYEYEVGTQNLPGITALLAGVNFIRKMGIDRIHKKESMLMQQLYEGLNRIQGIDVYGNVKECQGPVLSLNFKDLTASDAAYILESGYGIIVRSGLHCSPLIHQAMGTEKNGTVRISISCFTEEQEIREFIMAAEQIAASVRGR